MNGSSRMGPLEPLFYYFALAARRTKETMAANRKANHLITKEGEGGPKAVPEQPAVFPEDIPEQPIISPSTAKTAVFFFYVLAILHAWRKHTSADSETAHVTSAYPGSPDKMATADLRCVSFPEPASVAVPELVSVLFLPRGHQSGRCRLHSKICPGRLREDLRHGRPSGRLRPGRLRHACPKSLPRPAACTARSALAT
ncbi:hypothetical protein F2P79_022908 [Pimephales promelas]|nr:hypothetical protein F2P79_022908 [Pimephales promelas]